MDVNIRIYAEQTAELGDDDRIVHTVNLRDDYA